MIETMSRDKTYSFSDLVEGFTTISFPLNLPTDSMEQGPGTSNTNTIVSCLDYSNDHL